MSVTEEKDPFERGITHFNAQEFFEAHEAWEELWLRAPPSEKPFLQGIIQIAAALYHCGHGNLRGAKSLLAAGVTKMSRYSGAYLGIDVARLIREAQACVDGLPGGAGESRAWPQIHRAG